MCSSVLLSLARFRIHINMRTSFLVHLALAAVKARAQAADLLFPYNMTEVEYQQVSALGLTGMSPS